MTDPFKMLDLIEAQRIRADSQELSLWQAMLTLILVLEADTLDAAHCAATKYLQDRHVLGQPANALNQQARDYFQSAVERHTADAVASSADERRQTR